MKLIAKVCCTFFVFLNILCFSQTKEDIRSLVNKFCNTYFSDCFSGRSYVSNSITIDQASYISDNQIKAVGYHKYENFAGIVDKQPYEAIITVSRNSVKITFYKKSKVLLGEDTWEDCTKSFYFN